MNLFKRKRKSNTVNTFNVLQEIPIEKQRFYKNNFRTFFEGCYSVDPVIPISIISFGITNITFNKTNDNVIHMVITLTRPGMLIGRAGSTYNAITNYLNTKDEPFVIDIIESKLWQ